MALQAGPPGPWLYHSLTWYPEHPLNPPFASSVKCRLFSDFSWVLHGENQIHNRASCVWHGLVPSLICKTSIVLSTLISMCPFAHRSCTCCSSLCLEATAPSILSRPQFQLKESFLQKTKLESCCLYLLLCELPAFLFKTPVDIFLCQES